MPLSDLTATVFRRNLEQALFQMNVWAALAQDESAQLGDGAVTLTIPTDATVYALTTHTLANVLSATVGDHARGTPTVVAASKVDLTRDAFYSIDVLIPTWVLPTSGVTFTAEAASRMARVFVQQVNTNLRAKLLAVTAVTGAATITVATADWGNAAHLTAIDNALRAQALALDGVFVPREGRVAVTSPEMQDLIQEKLLTNNTFFPSAINDRIAVNRELPRYRGFDIVMDDSVGIGHTASDDARQLMSHFARGLGVVYAQDIRGIRGMESETYRGTRLVGDGAVSSLISRPTLVKTTTTVIS